MAEKAREHEDEPVAKKARPESLGTDCELSLQNQAVQNLISEKICKAEKEERDKNSHDIDSEIEGRTPEEISSIRKKKVALLISYCGAGYFGMQKNPGVDTIEDELLEALSKTGAIKNELKNDLGKLSFQRCARTDKGVSATRQVVSLKMVPCKELVPLINKELPPSIRVFGMIRVTKGFDSKNQCGARTYQYITPSFAFAPTEMHTVPSYRIKAPEIQRVNSILELMCGTHNFHNYTSGKNPNEASAKRYIIEFKAGMPYVKKGHEFIAISVKGQSFMLHQIRKMIGLCIAICKGFCDEDVITKSWGKEKMDIPKAPGLGLILDNIHYDRYNERYGSDGIHEKITWHEIEEEVEKFREEFIWDTIIESEITHKSMMKWLGTLKNHTYSENRINHRSDENDLKPMSEISPVS